MRYSFLLIIIISLVFSGCNHSSQKIPSDQTIVNIDLDKSGEGNLSDLFEGITYTLLDPGDDEVLVRPHKFIFFDSLIMVEDMDLLNIHLYTREGRLLHVFKAKGRGPGEFNQPDDFQIKDGQLIIKDLTLSKFIAFDLTGKFLWEEKTEILSPNFLSLKNGMLHYMNHQASIDDSNFYFIQTNGDAHGRVPIRPGYGIFNYAENNGFIQDPNRQQIFFSIPNTNEVAVFNYEGELEKTLLFDLGKYLLSDALKIEYNKSRILREKVVEGNFVQYVSAFFPFKNQYFLSLEQGQNTNHLIMLDDQFNVIFQANKFANDLDGMKIRGIPWTFSEDEVIFQISSNNFYNDYIEKFKGQKIRITKGSVHEFFDQNKEKLLDDQRVLVAMKVKKPVTG
jgi:hypothetical protein